MSVVPDGICQGVPSSPAVAKCMVHPGKNIIVTRLVHFCTLVLHYHSKTCGTELGQNKCEFTFPLSMENMAYSSLSATARVGTLFCCTSVTDAIFNDAPPSGIGEPSTKTGQVLLLYPGVVTSATVVEPCSYP